jgi:hypothetical protein
MRASWFGVVVVGAFTCACGPREAGPHEIDFGEVQFWEVAGPGEITFGEECTDADSFRGDIQPPEFQENSFIVFKISDDGDTATAQDCERIDPDTCEDDDLDIVFDRDDHNWTTTLPTQIIATGNPACETEMAQVWTLEDLGETLTLDVDLPTTLVGDPAACAAVEEAIVAEGTNGQGIDGCVVNLHVDTEFTASL